MSTKHHSCKGECGLEIAISPKDLFLKHKCRIIEKQSTAGFEEVPEIEYPDTYAPTNRMIQYDQHWAATFSWKVFGPLACLLDCGIWKNQLIFEHMGGGETNFNPQITTKDIGQQGHKYHGKISIHPGALAPGVYRVICCLQFCFEDGSPGPISGFCDLGLIKIYKDKKVRKSHSTTNGVADLENQIG